MATIPSGTQFIGLASTVNTVERRSAQINNESAPYTMQDITDTVSAGIPPSAPQMYIAIVNQTGTSAPDPFAIYSDFEPVSVFRNGVGTYTFVFSPGILNEKTIASIFLNGFSTSPNPPIYGISVEPANNAVYIKSYNTSGVAADELLLGSRFQIQVYE